MSHSLVSEWWWNCCLFILLLFWVQRLYLCSANALESVSYSQICAKEEKDEEELRSSIDKVFKPARHYYFYFYISSFAKWQHEEPVWLIDKEFLRTHFIDVMRVECLRSYFWCVVVDNLCSILANWFIITSILKKEILCVWNVCYFLSNWMRHIECDLSLQLNRTLTHKPTNVKLWKKCIMKS